MKNRKPNVASRTKQKGSVAVEYMILVVFLGLVVAAGAATLGKSINMKLGQISNTIETAQVPNLPNTNGV